MHINITKAMWENAALQKLLRAKPFSQDGHEFQWHEKFNMHIGNTPIPSIYAMRKIIDDMEGVEGTKTLSRDLVNWCEAVTSIGGAEKVRARSVQRGTEFMIQYLRRIPRHHVYRHEMEGDESAMVCYYVDEIEYCPREKECPERIKIGLAYEKFGKVHAERIMLYPKDVNGMTPVEILTNQGLVPATDKLRKEYELSCVRYAGIKDKIGQQFLARGTANEAGIDGNGDDDDYYWSWRRSDSVRLDATGEPSKVLIDIFRESEKERKERDSTYSTYFWKLRVNKSKHDDDDDDDDDDMDIEIPIHQYVVIFDMRRHRRAGIHVDNLTEYKWDVGIRDSLVLPPVNSKLIDTLLSEQKAVFKDLVRGKAGGIIVLCQGAPGTGKTLTAEISSEWMKRPLYTVQCSQLGVDPGELEANLIKVFRRGRRWNAIVLLDEADVYIAARGNNLQQNAIVGVFLRVLEYYAGVLFLTTNRGDLVDDAILSRCTVRIPYENPSLADQKLIWQKIAAANNLKLPQKHIDTLVSEMPKLSGRDIKNLIKLAMLVALDRKCDVTPQLVKEVKIFKPT